MIETKHTQRLDLPDRQIDLSGFSFNPRDSIDAQHGEMGRIAEQLSAQVSAGATIAPDKFENVTVEGKLNGRRGVAIGEQAAANRDAVLAELYSNESFGDLTPDQQSVLVRKALDEANLRARGQSAERAVETSRETEGPQADKNAQRHGIAVDGPLDLRDREAVPHSGQNVFREVARHTIEIDADAVLALTGRDRQGAAAVESEWDRILEARAARSLGARQGEPLKIEIDRELPLDAQHQRDLQTQRVMRTIEFLSAGVDAEVAERMAA